MIFGGKKEMRSWQAIKVGILPEDYWWKQLLVNLAWMTFFLLIQWLLSCI